MWREGEKYIQVIKKTRAMKNYGDEMTVSQAMKVSASAEEKQRRCVRYRAAGSLKARETQLVCVTSGNSFFGSHLVKELLAYGYLVRATIQNQVDFEDMKESLSNEEMNKLESVLVVKMGDLDGLCDAFRGCHAIFHTSSFIDPRGVSGYSERMAFLESEAAKNVIEACGRAAYVKRCIFTSSLLASIWNYDNTGKIINEKCWSSEQFCRENKLWLALGKTRSERVAWEKAEEMKVKLVTLCPGLLIPPKCSNATCLPYLKGGQVMLQEGVLGIAGEAKKVSEAHRCAYEEMDHGACGRYLCYERVITSIDDAIQVEFELKMNVGSLSGTNDHGLSSDQDGKFEIKLDNSRLANLVFHANNRVSCKLFNSVESFY